MPRTNATPRRKLFAIAALGCAWMFTLSSQAQGQTPLLPYIPHVALEGLAPTVRSFIQENYSAALAHPLDAAVVGRLAMSLHAHGLFPEAEPVYQRAYQLEPHTFRWVYLLALVQEDQANCSDAVSSFHAALQIDPGYFPAQLKLGECLLVSLNWTEAASLYESLTQTHPDSAEAFYGLGRVRLAHGDFDGAIAAYRKACELFPKFDSAHFALARIYQRQHKRPEADRELALARASEGGLPEVDDPVFDGVVALFRDTKAYLRVGTKLGGEGQFEDAAAAYEEALKLDPKITDAHIRLIYLYGRMRAFNRAAEHYHAAVRLDPKRADTYFNYGVVLLAQNQNGEAEAAFRKAIDLNPNYAAAHNNLAYLLEGEGKLVNAASEFRATLRLSPDSPQTHFGLGRLLVTQGNFSEGIPHLVAALPKVDADKRASYLYATGLAFADCGDLPNALRYLRLARDAAATTAQAGLGQSIADDLRSLAGDSER